jgi:hypothetical protein
MSQLVSHAFSGLSNFLIFDVIWCIELYCPDEGYPQKEQNTGEEILQMLSSLCYTSH